jgi:uncharacterized protein YndB with AHSA1/START domain
MMRMHHVHIEHAFSLPVQRVFAFLSEHEHLKLLFGAPVTRVRSGDHDRNGVGSCRRIGPPGPLAFEETVIEFAADELIVYGISKGSPLRGHRGTMRFRAAAGGGSRLDYRIQMASRVPGAAPLVKRMLERSVPAGLDQVDALA